MFACTPMPIEILNERKGGFKEIGRKRKARFIEGQYHDSILMDLLREEWLAKKPDD